MTIAKSKPQGLLLLFYLLPLTPAVWDEDFLYWKMNPETLGKA